MTPFSTISPLPIVTCETLGFLRSTTSTVCDCPFCTCTARDFAHVFLACARAAGVPARFVSGHFYSAGLQRVTDDAHAWTEAFVPQLGWIGFDPVNGICTTDAHARVAIGLDHLGAAPVRGTRYGGGETVSVAVQVAQAGRQNQ